MDNFTSKFVSFTPGMASENLLVLNIFRELFYAAFNIKYPINF